MFAGLQITLQEKYKMTNGEMNARWMNAEIATCAIAGRAANWPHSQSRHIVIVSDRFLILPRGRRNATHRSPKRVNILQLCDDFVRPI